MQVRGTVVNVRQGPGTSFPVLLQGEQGENYPLLERQGLWCRVGLPEGGEGWMFGRLVDVLPGPVPGSTPEAPEASPEPPPEGRDAWPGTLAAALLLAGSGILVWRRHQVLSFLDRRLATLAGYKRETPFRYDQRPPEKDRWEI